MCGLTGFWNFKASDSAEALISTVQSMAEIIKARGPDSHGAWCDEKVGLALGHRRLAIVDLSPAGHQPMVSHSGRFVIAYNGEVYNASELQEKLTKEGMVFKGHSDTEIILEACERWGVESACSQFVGMFAFALWDTKTQKLYLVRDRIGKKPLYWGFNEGILFFGSQIKSFTGYPHWAPVLDKNVLATYFRFNYVPTPLSIYKGIYKLKPGTILIIDKSKNTQEIAFWNYEHVLADAEQNRKLKSLKTDNEWMNECDLLLKDAVKRRMIADVPLGAFLSGGIDSSLVVAMMQSESITPIKTFSIGFHESEYDEAKHAESVANHLKTEHHELYVSSDEARRVIPKIPDWFDEPFADVSQIPTFLVSRLAAQHVKVSLSGDGGDELFAGYNRYLFGEKIWKKNKLLPAFLRFLLAKGVRQFSPSHWDNLARLLPSSLKLRLLGDKAYKFADLLEAKNAYHFYRNLVSYWPKPQELVVGSHEVVSYPWENAENIFNHTDNMVETMQFIDLLTYLPDDILAKVDRASMAVSLEARVPLLDHRVVEFAAQLPMDLKIRGKETKWLLRQVLDRYVPRKLIERPKMGFGVPIDNWLRGPLKEWAENLLLGKKLEQEGILNSTLIQRRWREHISGERNWQYSLWGVLMFEAWKERW